MSRFSQLPTDIACQILCSWCNVESLTKFDAANSDRSYVTSAALYDSSQFILEDDDICTRTGCIKWVSLRKLKFQILDLEINEFTCRSGSIYLDMKLGGVRTLVLKEFHEETRLNEEDLLKLINSCPRLSSLSLLYLKSLSDETFQTIDKNILKQLNKLSFIGASPLLTTQSVEFISTHCPKLTSVGIGFAETELNEQVLIDFLHTSRHIQELEICGFQFTNRLLQTISTNCKKLRTLCASDNNPNDVSYAQLADFICANPQLTSLAVHSVFAGTYNQDSSFAYSLVNDKKSVTVCACNLLDENFDVANVDCYHNYLDFFLRITHISALTLHSFNMDAVGEDFITEELIKHIAKTSPSLESLTLRSSDSVNMRIMVQFLTHFTALTAVSLCDLFDFPCSELVDIFNTPNNVKALSISDDEDITSDVVLSILRNNPNITSIHLNNCYMIDVLAIQSYVDDELRAGKQLEFVEFGCGDGVGEESDWVDLQPMDVLQNEQLPPPAGQQGPPPAA